MLFPVDLPAGVYSNGTDLDATGRWRETNLVRWEDDSLRPVGGWSERVADVTDAPPRGMLAWVDNAGDRWLAVGIFDQLNVVTVGGAVSDISPASLVSGNEDATQNLGYGGGLYGAGAYGTPREDNVAFEDATTWSLDTWGQFLVACSPDDGRLVEWQLNTGTPAAVISNAPTSCSALVVTEERFLFALGAGGDPRKVQWSDREDNTTWTPAATNEAGDQVLQTNGSLMAGIRTRGGTIILTTTDCWLATYQGPPFVYGFERVGSACGLQARKAVVSVDEGVFWMGRNGFFRWSGGAVEELDCDVRDHVFEDINVSQISKAWGVSNAKFGEVWFFYPSQASTEIDRYVGYCYRTGRWMTGQLDRTAGVDVGVFATPIWADSTGDLYDHETGTMHGGEVPYAESGPISFGDVVTAMELIPDEKTQGQVTMTVKTRFYPNGTETDHGPYTLTNPTSVRFTGRQMRVRVGAVENEAWRFGTPRFRLNKRGER